MTRRTDGPEPEQAGPSMYERLGVDNVRHAVELFYSSVCGDPRLAPFFHNINMRELKRHQALMIGQVLGGPVYFTPTQLREVHGRIIGPPSADYPTGQRLLIENLHYWLVVGHLASVLTDLGVDRDIVMHLLGSLYDVRPFIVNGEPVSAPR